MSRSSKRKAGTEATTEPPLRKVRRTSVDLDDRAEDDFAGFDDDGGDSAVEEVVVAPVNKRKKGKKAAKEALPLPELKTVYEGGTVKLQVDSLLASVRPSTQKAAPLHALIDALRSTLLASKSSPATAVPTTVKALRKRGLAVPFLDPRPADDVQWKLAYDPPLSVEATGSWPLGAACKWKGADGWSVDLAVRMPDSLLQANDVKAYRYFHKRAYYVACLAAALQESPLARHLEITFGQLNGDARKPIIEIRSKKDSSDFDFSALRCFIRLIPCYDLATSPLKISRLSPVKGNIRAAENEVEEATPSPSYNASLLLDGLVQQHHIYLSETQVRSPHFPAACQLLKIWAHQRGYGEHASHDSECGLEGARRLLKMMLAHLLAKGGKQEHRLPMRADAWQLFRGCLDYLAHGDFVKKPVFMRGEVAGKYVEGDFSAAGGPIFVEPAGLVNLLVDVPPAALELLQRDASATLQALADRGDEGFDAALLRPSHARHLRFDNSAAIRLAPEWLSITSTLPDAASPVSAVVQRLSSVLRRALGTRAHAVSLSSSTAPTRPLKQTSSPREAQLTLGVSLISAEASRLVDFGPSAEDELAAKDFREFWGDKCELRRFKDGSILESIVWQADTPLARGAIVGQILRYILHDSPHFHLPADDVEVFAAAFDTLLSDLGKPPDKGFAAVQAAFDGLSKTMRQVEGLPLKLSSVAPASEALRYSSVFVPSATIKTFGIPLVSRFIPIMDVHLTFETSSRWPSDLEGVQKVKAALLTKLGERLKAIQGDNRFLQVEIAFDPNAPAQADNVALELLASSGLAFRLRIHYEAESALLDAASIDAGRHSPAGERYLRMLSQHDKRFSLRPRHHAAISSLQHRHASFSAGVRILKRWFGAHLLSPHVTSEAIELLMASVYLSPGAQSVPASGATAFARALERMRTWDWRAGPLLVPVYTAVEAEVGRVQFPEDKAVEALRSFETVRKQDPLVRRGAWLMATEMDLSGKAWTWEAPSRVVVGRIVELASATLAALEEGLRTRSLEPRQLFATPLDGFDFLIHLDPAQLPRHSQALDVEPSLLLAKPPLHLNATRPPLGFDPAHAFVDRVQAYVGDAAMLFHDLNGGSIVAGVFDPSLAKAREFRVHLGFPCKPVEGGEEEEGKKRRVTLDREALLEGVKRIGGGLVERIELH